MYFNLSYSSKSSPQLIGTYVRPHLEFAVPGWNPYRKGDIDILEKVQRRATKISRELHGLRYENRCKKTKMNNTRGKKATRKLNTNV